MKKALLSALFLSFTAHGQNDRTGYLREVLRNLERIETSSFCERAESYPPGDTIPHVRERFCKTFANPADTTLGVKFLNFDAADTSLLLSGYDGMEKAGIEYDDKYVLTDDFSTLRLPFRPVTLPFFSCAENILRYALTTSDRIATSLDDTGGDMRFRLTVDEDRQVEFFGRAYHMPAEVSDPRSVYEIWIRKSDNLPYRIRREMEHETTVKTISEVSINTLPQTDWRLSDFYPADFTVRRKGAPKNPAQTPSAMLDRKAPAWSLADADGQTVSLRDFKCKVLLINFTGIGCGACQTAIPFLNSLHERFASADFGLVAIESWKKQRHSIRVYSAHNQLTYPLLEGTEPVVRAYLTSPSVPVFFLLDSCRTIRKIVEGYSRSMNDEITQAIENLIQEAE